MKKKITPVQILLSGYIIITLAGALALSLPASSAQNNAGSLIDALFTSASALSTTGLAVVDTGTYYSTFGQIIILALIQIGGLGYMIFVALVVMAAGYRFSLNGKQLFNESIAKPSGLEIKQFVKAVVYFTLAFEIAGAIVLAVVFLDKFNIVEALYSGIFHSISAFCTAGFSLYSDSFTSYAYNFTANVIIAVITIAGGLGFFVLFDLYNYLIKYAYGKKPNKLSDHSKLVLTVTFVLIVVGTAMIYFSEKGNGGAVSMTDRLWIASFQTVSASSTTGFNSVDIGSMREISLFMLIILMFIGASPGGTGGGIKTSTFGVVFSFIKKVILRGEEVNIFKHTVSISTVDKAITISVMSFFYLTFIVTLLLISESFSFLKIVFETASALGTVGLSTGITPALTTTGKIIITITMIVGRIGPLAIGYSLISKTEIVKYSYPQGNILTG